MREKRDILTSPPVAPACRLNSNLAPALQQRMIGGRPVQAVALHQIDTELAQQVERSAVLDASGRLNARLSLDYSDFCRTLDFRL
jgi:hypothetical protein